MTGLALAFATALQTSPLPLPERTDIPEGYSTVICPDRAAAERMLGDFYAVAPPPNNFTHDIPLFFEGLGSTGCEQGGPLKVGTITIETVLMRRTFEKANGAGQVIAFRGVNGDGVTLVGIVDETGNDAYPRTPLGFWLESRSEDGTLLAHPSDEYTSPTYVCPSFGAANASVLAIPDKDGVEIGEDAATATFEAALAANGCAETEGRYRITALGEERAIFCGYECAYGWTALETENAEGETVGLIYDGSLM